MHSAKNELHRICLKRSAKNERHCICPKCTVLKMRYIAFVHTTMGCLITPAVSNFWQTAWTKHWVTNVARLWQYSYRFQQFCLWKRNRLPPPTCRKDWVTTKRAFCCACEKGTDTLSSFVFISLCSLTDHSDLTKLASMFICFPSNVF